MPSSPLAVRELRYAALVKLNSVARGARARRGTPPAPPTLLVLSGIASVQLGAAVAKHLFARVGPGGTVLLRLLFAALVLCALTRPRLRGLSRRQLLLVLVFGAVLAVMNGSFYAAIDRIPLGIAVTVEFSGPLAVAIIGSRRLLDALWVVLAGAGVVLLTRGSGGGGALNPAGLGLAAFAGACWACYILLGKRLGRSFAGHDGLALATAVGAALLVPVGVAQGGRALLDWRVLAVGVAVGLLSSAIPYSLELEALRWLPARVFGVFMSLEPAVAALVGFVVLGEHLLGREIAAIALVSAASAGAALADQRAATTGLSGT